jgi:phosphoribosylanthranilate isomerase
MRVKICGLMRPEDVKAALNYGADAVGFVVGTPSASRNLTITQAEKLMRHVPVYNLKVAVSASKDLKELKRISNSLKPDALQLHYHTRQIVEELRKDNPNLRMILATHMDEKWPTRLRLASKYSDAIIADSPSETNMGGTGRSHDWAITARARRAIHPHPLILAGGLTPENVSSAIRQVRPYAVDVSSGVERKTGIKDHKKIKEFIKNAKETRP